MEYYVILDVQKSLCDISPTPPVATPPVLIRMSFSTRHASCLSSRMMTLLAVEINHESSAEVY